MTETEEVTWDLPSRSHCGREMDCTGRRNWSWNCWGSGAVRHKWGSIRIMVDDGWGEMAPGMKRGSGLHTTNELIHAPAHEHTLWHTHIYAIMVRQAWTETPGRQITQSHTRRLNHTKWRHPDQSVLVGLRSHSLSGKLTHVLSWFWNTQISK